MAAKKVSPYRDYVLDYRRGEKVFPLAVESRLALRYPYDTPSVQRQSNLDPSIEWGGLKHAIFLFLACLYQKGGIDSEVAIRQMSNLRVARPHLFDPFYFLKFDPEESVEKIEELIGILMRYGLGSNSKDAARSWVYNMQKLARFWDGDPRLLFQRVILNAEWSWKSVRNANELYQELCRIMIRRPSMPHEKLVEQPNGFYGFRHKMVSMLAYFLVDAGILPSFAYPPPIDFHLIRFLCATEIIRFKNREPGTHINTTNVLPGARRITLWYIVKTRIPPEVFAEAMWVLSRELCRRSPGNKCSVDKTRKARAREIYEHPVVWTPGQQRRYERTCGMCPLEGVCEWNIQSAYYYVKGVVRLSRRRQRLPQRPLIDLRTIPLVKGSRRLTEMRELPVIQAHQLQMFV